MVLAGTVNRIFPNSPLPFPGTPFWKIAGIYVALPRWIGEINRIAFDVHPAIEGQRFVIIALPGIFGGEASSSGIIHSRAQIHQLRGIPSIFTCITKSGLISGLVYFALHVPAARLFVVPQNTFPQLSPYK